MRTIGSILLATFVFGGLVVVAGQERSPFAGRRPISSRSTTGSPDRVKQRVDSRKRGKQVLRFNELFERDVESGKSAARRGSQTKAKPTSSAVARASHTLIEEKATQSFDDEPDFVNPFEDDPESDTHIDWEPDAVGAKPKRWSVESQVKTPLTPLRSTFRRRPEVTPVPREPGRLRRGLRPSGRSSSQSTVESPAIPRPASETARWASQSPNVATRPIVEPSIKQRDPVEMPSAIADSSLSEIPLIVPDPIPTEEPEVVPDVPTYERNSRAVSMSRIVEAKADATRFSRSEIPHEPHPSPAAPTRMTRQQRQAAIVARGNLSGFKGFCPVELRDRRLLVDSVPTLFANFGRRTYYFSTTEARDRFLQNPVRYTPAANGADVVALLEDTRTISGRLDYAVWFHNKLYLFASAKSLELFNANPARYASP